MGAYAKHLFCPYACLVVWTTDKSDESVQKLMKNKSFLVRRYYISLSLLQ